MWQETRPDPGVPNPLPVAKILLGAVLLPWHQRARFAQAVAIPVLVQVLLMLAWQYSALSLDVYANWLLYAIHLALYILIAVRCHRLMLLDPPEKLVWELPRWGWRETRFAACILGLGAVFIAITMAGGTVIGTFAATVTPSGASWSNTTVNYSPYVASILAYYPISRLSLALPAQAIDSIEGFKVLWRRSAGNSLRLCLVVGGLPLLFSYLMGLSYFSSQSPLPDIIYHVLTSIVVIVEVAALSLAYRELRKQFP